MAAVGLAVSPVGLNCLSNWGRSKSYLQKERFYNLFTLAHFKMIMPKARLAWICRLFAAQVVKKLWRALEVKFELFIFHCSRCRWFYVSAKFPDVGLHHDSWHELLCFSVSHCLPLRSDWTFWSSWHESKFDTSFIFCQRRLVFNLLFLPVQGHKGVKGESGEPGRQGHKVTSC